MQIWTLSEALAEHTRGREAAIGERVQTTVTAGIVMQRGERIVDTRHGASCVDVDDTSYAAGDAFGLVGTA